MLAKLIEKILIFIEQRRMTMARTKGIFFKRCPYCNGRNLYLKRTFPEHVLGCRDCDKRVKLLRQKGLTNAEIKAIIET